MRVVVGVRPCNLSLELNAQIESRSYEIDSLLNQKVSSESLCKLLQKRRQLVDAGIDAGIPLSVSSLSRVATISCTGALPALSYLIVRAILSPSTADQIVTAVRMPFRTMRSDFSQLLCSCSN